MSEQHKQQQRRRIFIDHALTDLHNHDVADIERLIQTSSGVGDDECLRSWS